MSGCPIRCTSITTSTRARPIPVRATGLRDRVYQEDALPVSYRHRPHYDSYRARPYYGYRYSVRPSVRYGYAPRHGY